MNKFKFVLKVIAVILLALSWFIFVWNVLSALGITPKEFASIPKYQ